MSTQEPHQAPSERGTDIGPASLWFKNAVFYEVHIRSFCDSNGDGKGDLPGLTSRLEYLRDLGIDCIWLLPMFPSPLNDDGYDISDYTAIHPDYGTLSDFKHLVSRAHDLGLRVITDLVLNHTSDQHPWFQEARKSPDNRYRDFYVWSDVNSAYQDARVIFIDTENSNWTWDPEAGQFFWHRFYSSQPDLNFENPAVADAMMDVMRFWLDMGIDGFRADALPYLYEAEGTNCENLPKTHDYLKRVRRMMDNEYPDAILLGEVNQQPSELRPYFGGANLSNAGAGHEMGDELHMAFHFPLMPRIYKALATGDSTDIVETIQQTPSIPSNCQWCVFLRNHDELTLEMVTPEDRELLWNAYAPDPGMRLNLGIRRRLAPLLDNDPRRIELVNSILFSIAGTPVIYYGDEIGMGDDISLPDRNGVRTPMQWNGQSGAGFSIGPDPHSWVPLISHGIYGYPTVNVERQVDDPESLLTMTKRFIAIRKENPVLGWGACEFVPATDTRVLAYTRVGVDEAMIVVANLSAQVCEAHLSLPGFAGRSVEDPFTGVVRADILGVPLSARMSIALKPYEYLWRRVV